MAAIHIDLNIKEIPVEIGGLSFNIVADDDYLDAIDEAMSDLSGYLSYNSDNSYKKEERNEHIRKACDIFLGDGAFDRIYDKCLNSTLIAASLMKIHEDVFDDCKNDAENIIKKSNKNTKRYHKKKKVNVQSDK